MGSNQEIARIQEWVANWYGTSVENSPFSREDIRNICRGPMREVLVDFLISRFRTDAQIKVIRSNLFLTDLVDSRSVDDNLKGSGDSGSQDEEQLKQLKRKVEDIQEQKVNIVKQILKAFEKMRESNMHVQKDFLENLSHFEKLESRMQLINHRVLSTARLLDDVSYIKPPNTGTLDSASSSSSNGASKTETNSSHLSQLKSLYNKASDLFNIYFHQKPFTSNGSFPEVQSLSSVVSTQTVELAQSGVKPNSIEKWARKEQEISNHQINKVELKFSNVMSPVEELANEAEALHIKLMKAHVNLYFKNREIRKSMREIKAQKSRRIQNVVLSDATVVPADFLSFIQKEEQQRKLIKCRELKKEFKSLENCGSGSKEVDLLAMLCGKGCGSDENGSIQIPGSSNDELVASSDGGFNYINQENLEELTCALLKGFPDGRHKLESTVSQCKTLMDKFANLFCGETVNNSDKIDSVHTERRDKIYEALDLHVILPKQDLKFNFSVPTTNEQDQMDSLREVFRLQNELKESRLQFEAMCHIK